jgi:hypothetical protein
MADAAPGLRHLCAAFAMAPTGITVLTRDQGPRAGTHGLPQRTVGALAGWSCALPLSARTEALAGANPRTARCFRDGLASVLGAVHVGRAESWEHEHGA